MEQDLLKASRPLSFEHLSHGHGTRTRLGTTHWRLNFPRSHESYDAAWRISVSYSFPTPVSPESKIFALQLLTLILTRCKIVPDG